MASETSSAIATPNTSQKLHLLTLPAEIRMEIYTHVFPAPSTARSFLSSTSPAPEDEPATVLAPLLTCRQFHSEAFPIAFANTVFFVRIIPPVYFFVTHITPRARVLRSMNREKAQCVRHVQMLWPRSPWQTVFVNEFRDQRRGEGMVPRRGERVVEEPTIDSMAYDHICASVLQDLATLHLDPAEESPQDERFRKRENRGRGGRSRRSRMPLERLPVVPPEQLPRGERSRNGERRRGAGAGMRLETLGLPELPWVVLPVLPSETRDFRRGAARGAMWPCGPPGTKRVLKAVRMSVRTAEEGVEETEEMKEWTKYGLGIGVVKRVYLPSAGLKPEEVESLIQGTWEWAFVEGPEVVKLCCPGKEPTNEDADKKQGQWIECRAAGK